MKTLLSGAALFLFLSLTGCMPEPPMTGTPAPPNKQMEIWLKWRSEPDAPGWYAQRQQITQAMGDRVFDKDFNRVFGSLMVAVANMGMTVDNMERQSGYIVAKGELLAPEVSMQLRSEERASWFTANGYDLSLMPKGGDGDVGWDIMDQFGQAFVPGKRALRPTVTISLVRQSEKQTKVKLRFNEVYYPRTLEEYYKAAWPAIDKQIFIDGAIDGSTVLGMKG